jgi:beta-N-acetylhexosaminidase
MQGDEDGDEIVPFICADQEGGRVAAFRFKEFPVQPSAFLLGSLGDPAIVETAAYATAQQLRYLGLNMNLAPVADLYFRADSTIIGDRSFGPDPVAVGSAVVAYVRGLTRGGVIPTLKHFPGHGVTTIDSHADLPVVASDRSQLIEHDMLPFGEGIRAGAPVVMTAHILYPAIDPTNPATLSPLILNELLRDTLGFDGIILTDGFEMGALSKTLGKRESLLRALQAGINLILLYNRYDPTEMIDLLESLVQEGLVPLETIDKNVERILKVKANYGLL